jgi:hypothetical protein
MEQKVFKQEILGYVLLTIVILFCLSSSILGLAGKIALNTNLIIGLFAISLFFILLLISYAKTKISIDDSGITFQTLFKRQHAGFSEILRVETSAKLVGSSQGAHGKYVLVIHFKEGNITIPIKQFSRSSLKELSRLIIDKCTNTMIDKQTQLMAEGKMPSIFFKSH